jgi:hypothetical protein
MTLNEVPKPTDLMDHPQLAAIAVLQTALDAALRLLLAQHSVLLDTRYPRDMTEADTWADRILFQGHSLASTLQEYRDAIEVQTHPSQDPAF